MEKHTSTFPYQYKDIGFGPLVNPLIQIPVKTEAGWQNLWFLLDSGADTTTVPLSLARKLRLPYDRHRQTQIVGVGDQSISAYEGSIHITLNTTELTVRTYFINAQESTLLLGRLDIFNQFIITFNNIYFFELKVMIISG